MKSTLRSTSAPQEEMGFADEISKQRSKEQKTVSPFMPTAFNN